SSLCRLGPAIHPLSQASAPCRPGRGRGLPVPEPSGNRAPGVGFDPAAGAKCAALVLSGGDASAAREPRPLAEAQGTVPLAGGADAGGGPPGARGAGGDLSIGGDAVTWGGAAATGGRDLADQGSRFCPWRADGPPSEGRQGSGDSASGAESRGSGGAP